MGIKVPCYNCESRQYGCHSVCQKYLEYRDQIEDKNRKLDAARFLDGMEFERNEKARKRRRKK